MRPGGVERIEGRGRNAERTLAALERAGDLDAAIAVLERALELAELHAVPEQEEAFASFATGPLLDAASAMLGEAATTSVLAELMPERDPSSGLYTVGSRAAREEQAVAAPLLASAARLPCVIVDRDEAARARTARRLEREGFAVIECDDALAALEASIEHEPALLIAPREAPALDGLTLARLVRLRMRDAGPAVILHGAGALEGEDARLVRLVPDDRLIAEAKKLVGRP